MSVITPRYQPDYVVNPGTLSIEEAANAWENLQNNFRVLFEDLATLAGNVYFVDGDTPVAMADGGTGASLTADLGEVVYSTGSALALTSGASSAKAGYFLQLATAWVGAGPAPIWSSDLISATTIDSAYIYRVGGTDVAVADGGTGLSSYAVGDLLYASGTTTIGKLADVATGSVLISGGVGVAPVWSTDLATGVTIGTAYIYRVGGTDVAVTDGGTGLSVYAVGDVLYADTTTTLAKLADVAAGAVLVSGGVGVAPAWSTAPTFTGTGTFTQNASAGDVIPVKITATDVVPPIGYGAYLQIGSSVSARYVHLGVKDPDEKLYIYTDSTDGAIGTLSMSIGSGLVSITGTLSWGGGSAITDSSRVLTDI